MTYTTVVHHIKPAANVLNEKKQISTRNLIRENPKIEEPTAKKLNQTVQIVPLVSANSLEPVKIEHIAKEDKDLRNKHALGNFI